MSNHTRTGPVVGVVASGNCITCQCAASPDLQNTAADVPPLPEVPEYPRYTGCLLCEAAGFDGDFCRHGIIVAKDWYKCPSTDSNYSPEAVRALRQDPLWQALVFRAGVYEPPVFLSVTRSTIYMGVNYGKGGEVKVEIDSLEALKAPALTNFGRTESLRLQHALTPAPIRNAALALLACGFRFIGEDLQPPQPLDEKGVADLLKNYRPGLQEDTASAIWHIHMVRGRLTDKGVPVGISVNFQYMIEPPANPTPWIKDEQPSAS